MLNVIYQNFFQHAEKKLRKRTILHHIFYRVVTNARIDSSVCTFHSSEVLQTSELIIILKNQFVYRDLINFKLRKTF